MLITPFVNPNAKNEWSMRNVANGDYGPLLGARVGLVCHDGSFQFWEWNSERNGFTALRLEAWLSPVVNDPRTERVIMALIVVNAVILGLETSKSVMASYGRLLEILDHIILAVFVIEIAARVIVHRFAFFRDPWSVFDFIVIGIALVPATETFSVLRSLRVLRVLRLITGVPTLRRVVAGLLAALPGMDSIVLLQLPMRETDPS
jgi:hypothetical protein